TRAAFGVEERLELAGWAGEQDDDLAVRPALRAVDCRVEPLAGGAAGFVLEEDGAVDDVGLLLVVGRHGDAAGDEFLLQREEGCGVAMEGEAESGGDGFAGEVVLGGAEAAGEDDDVGAADGDGGGAAEVVEVVAHDGFERDGDAEL